MRNARLFDIQRGSLVDGPGIRTVFFFYGCPMRCAWCHNPEGIGNVQSDRFAVREYTVRELFDIAKEDIPFYRPDGGITCSGGECMLQGEFLTEFLKECRREGIHTAIDTAGNVPFESFSAVLPYTDLFLYDLKCVSPDLHLAYTGVDNALILENLKELFARGARVHIRIPLIPECNGNEAEMLAIREHLRPFCPESVTLLPYHTLGDGKYRRLGLAVPAFTVPEEEIVRRFRDFLKE